jgi:hypothetical protein
MRNLLAKKAGKILLLLALSLTLGARPAAADSNVGQYWPVALAGLVPLAVPLWSLFNYTATPALQGISANCNHNWTDDCYSPNVAMYENVKTFVTAGQKPEKIDEHNCTIYRNGCKSCPGPMTDTVFRSPQGHLIRIQHPGQNHLQPGIVEVLKTMADRRGKNMNINSAFRSCEYQLRTHQGVPKSEHLMGRAADFTFEGESSSSAALASFARSTLNSMGMGGGTGVYCGRFSHVDTGNNRQWNWCR